MTTDHRDHSDVPNAKRCIGIMEKGRSQMTDKPPATRLTIIGLIGHVFVLSLMIHLVVSAYKQRVEKAYRNRVLDQYRKESKDFSDIMIHISKFPLAGVDSKLWMSSIHELANEHDIHPLRKIDQVSGPLSVLAKESTSLAQINEYLRQNLLTSPIDIETPPALRKRILQDYDPLKRLTFTSWDHPQNCNEEFDKFMDSLRRSRRAQPEQKKVPATTDTL